MISVSLTSNRHLAAATAAYIATIPADPEATPYASVNAYVQAALERVADSWVESTRVDQISVGEFVLRFTGSEFAAITAAAANDANVAAILETLRARDSVRLGSVDAVSGIAYLVAAGLLTAERGEDVLRYDVPLPPGAQIQESGDVLLPTGELIAAADIEGMPDAPTIPSEFADALDV